MSKQECVYSTYAALVLSGIFTTSVKLLWGKYEFVFAGAFCSFVIAACGQAKPAAAPKVGALEDNQEGFSLSVPVKPG